MTIACPDCGTLQDVPPLHLGDVAQCRCCRAVLERVNARSITAALFSSAATLLLLFPANILPLFTLSFANYTAQTWLSSGVLALAGKGWILLALMIAVCGVILPFVRYALLSVALASARLQYRPPWLGPVFRWAILLDRWTMPEVMLVACMVGYARVSAQASIIHVDAGGYCFLAAALLAMLSRALLDRRTVWRAIAPERAIQPDTRLVSCTVCDLVMPLAAEGRPCPRCGLKLRARSPGTWERTLALVIAAALLYIPANLLPMSVTYYPGRVHSYRIIDGVMELFAAGLWPLGVLITCTSIGIPVAKLLGLGWCLWSIRRPSRRFLVLKTTIYRMIDEVGRWSNVDPFIIAMIVPLIHFRTFVITDAGGGSIAFIAVVMLTMAASRGFDPRLMWDAALQSPRDRAARRDTAYTARGGMIPMPAHQAERPT